MLEEREVAPGYQRKYTFVDCENPRKPPSLNETTRHKKPRISVKPLTLQPNTKEKTQRSHSATTAASSKHRNPSKEHRKLDFGNIPNLKAEVEKLLRVIAHHSSNCASFKRELKAFGKCPLLEDYMSLHSKPFKRTKRSQ